jgi:hypothetical protein
MSEQEYEDYLKKKNEREKVLDKYEDFVKSNLTEYPDSSLLRSMTGSRRIILISRKYRCIPHIILSCPSEKNSIFP